VGKHIEAWEHVRPIQPGILDEETGEFVDYSFINSDSMPLHTTGYLGAIVRARWKTCLHSSCP
jgi:hypothetical protein